MEYFKLCGREEGAERKMQRGRGREEEAERKRQRGGGREEEAERKRQRGSGKEEEAKRKRQRGRGSDIGIRKDVDIKWKKITNGGDNYAKGY
ncbi:hypothetical protein POVCU2_0014940 [Plasmodium ovale curtisi]|uniref:Uncharacterized protein n=1 Tax=Plasmodium ovale curtisi TaxID=864141 RepID=A0A1A8W1U9_PLAOA|nr:hypothetical protein POVCU2_0014940 [Plasmodium ovale curtisi]SBS86745.1 hypothetical protein POVCU1_013710 [Plasmodium ovale curtisi]